MCESETCVTPVVTKDFEMTPVCKSLCITNNEVLLDLSEFEITADNQKKSDVTFYLRRERSRYAASRRKEGRRSSKQLFITEMIN